MIKVLFSFNKPLETMAAGLFACRGYSFGSRRLGKKTFYIAFFVATITAGHANAFVVNVGGQEYDVTTFTGSYNDDPLKFETKANGGEMPWWGSESLAQSFATAVRGGLGTPNSDPPIINAGGPFFAFSRNFASTNGGPLILTSITARMDTPSANPPFPTQLYVGISNSRFSWAQANLYQGPPLVSVPGPLPLFGSAAAFGFSRRLRARIKSIKTKQEETSV
jgi:hypothetical protein